MKSTLYQVDPDDLEQVDLGGLTGIYHERSGMTHIVAPPAPQILALLQAGPLDLAGMLVRLKAVYDLEEDAEDMLRLRLDELEAAGLVSRA